MLRVLVFTFKGVYLHATPGYHHIHVGLVWGYHVALGAGALVGVKHSRVIRVLHVEYKLALGVGHNHKGPGRPRSLLPVPLWREIERAPTFANNNNNETR